MSHTSNYKIFVKTVDVHVKFYSVFHFLLDIQVVNDTCFIVIEYIASILYLHQRYCKAVVAIRGLLHQVFAHLYPAIHA